MLKLFGTCCYCCNGFFFYFLPKNVPVPETQWQVPLAHVGGWVHASKEPEVWVAHQRLCGQNTEIMVSNI